MTKEKLNAAVYTKMSKEQERYTAWLLTLTPKEMLYHTYEYTVRQDILCAAEEAELSAEQCFALLESDSPLADILRDFEKLETDYMDILRECITARADRLTKLKKEG